MVMMVYKVESAEFARACRKQAGWFAIQMNHSADVYSFKVQIRPRQVS
jgi:hypothetical protein